MPLSQFVFALIATCGLVGTALADSEPEGSFLRPVEDFHPETDRWTEHNNRIRLSSWTGAWFFGTDLDIRHDLVTGARVSWEVPGFIGIRWDSGLAPRSRADVDGLVGGARISRRTRGVVHAHTLGLAIFNPELSVPNLALWAGFGAGVFAYDYDEPQALRGATQVDDLEGFSFSVNVFVELDYRIVDVFHVGLGLRQHALLGDNRGGVSEATLNLSILF